MRYIYIRLLYWWNSICYRHNTPFDHPHASIKCKYCLCEYWISKNENCKNEDLRIKRRRGRAMETRKRWEASK